MIVPERLSSSTAKRRLYAEDPHFRAGYVSFANAVGSEAVTDLTWPLASVILKPESLAGRTAGACCTFLFGHGFVPLAAAAVHISSLAVRELWRYQINVATEERLYAMDRIFASGPSVYLAFRYPGGGRSASSVLDAIKGPSEPSKRAPWHLRASIGARPSRLLTHIHAAEEPADVIRDLGVLFDMPQRQELVRSLQRGGIKRDRMIAIVNDAANRYPPHDLDPARSISRLRSAIDSAVDQGTGAAATLASNWLAAAERGAASDWQCFVESLCTIDIDVTAWDLITIGSEVMTMDLVDECRLLTSSAPADRR